jgi:ABC-2 type transport system permease protein
MKYEGIKELIAVEWYKLRHSRLFLLVLFFMSGQAIIQIGLVSFINTSPIASQQENSFLEIFNFPPLGENGILLIGGTSLTLSLCLAAFAGLFVAAEFQNNTIRAPISLGKNRVYVFIAKLISLAIVVLAEIMVVWLIATIGLTILFGFGDSSILEYGKRLVIILGTQFRLHGTFAAVFCMIAFMSKSIGVTIIGSVVYVLAFSIFMSFAGSFEAISFLTKIIPQYYIAAFNELYHDTGFMAGSVAVSVFYLAIPSVIGILGFNKSDIK